MSLYTDLASEARELNPEIDGVTEERESRGEIEITRTVIITPDAARKLNKRMGRYVTLDAPGLIYRPLDLFKRMAEVIAEELGPLLKESREGSIVVVGLGNRAVTPDSLGPRTAERIFVTRHVKELLPEAFSFPVPSVAQISPGVLGSTGVETLELIRGVKERVKPDLIIAVDSLASRRAARISTTVQITDSGIDPGSGVGNIRAGLNEETVGVPVIAIGVPLVVYASTITQDTISMIAEENSLSCDEEALKSLAEKVVSERMDEMIMTPKDIDAIIEDMSSVVSEGINRAVFGEHYEKVRMLIA